ncbi:MAG: GGDEF domain-containing protein [Lachnospiraceae bacterium]|nr:GGDEF domain-containing protein [Lachnospiraceae bacterium]
MDETGNNEKQICKKPLSRSIAAGCVMFTAIICIVLSFLNYYNERKALYQRYRSYITDILRYVERNIDDEDLKECIESQKESETYKKTLRFMDQMMNDFDIHYLYAIKPLNDQDTNNVMSVLSAEDDYNRYVDTEGNLYLGWISDDEFDAETVRKFFDVMERDDIMFFVEKTEWSTDYTGALALRGKDGESYAVLAVDVDITTLAAELATVAGRNALLVVLLGALYLFSFLRWSKKNITRPLQLLEEGAVNYAYRSRGQRDLDALVFDAPDIHTENEVESLSAAITEMTENMREYVTDILTAEEETKQMKAIATADALTGVRNKTAYNREEVKLQAMMSADPDAGFGLAMVDLNYLKVINDTYGHDKGDEALKNITHIICTVFAHSPIFRIGGDEFAVVLRGSDLENVDALKEEFVRQAQNDPGEEPWKNVSAAIGVAVYEKGADRSVADVFKRADEAMYIMKKSMRAERK